MADLGGAHAARLAILDQRDVGRGAPDVERQDILEAGMFRHPQRAGDAARGPRHQQRDRLLLGLFRRHQPAVRAQQREPALHLDLLELAAQIADVAADDGAHRGIGDRGQRALIFLHLGQNLVAERDRHVGQDLGRQLGHRQLVRAVEIGVDQRDGQGHDRPALCRLLPTRWVEVHTTSLEIDPIPSEVQERARASGREDP